MLDSTRWDRATAHLEPPLAVVDLAAFDANADDLHQRAQGTPMRVASKSVRCRELIRRALDRPGFQGLMTYSLAESNWLVDQGLGDILIAYPTVDGAAIRDLVGDERRRREITLMIDSTDHLDLVDSAAPGHPEVRICLDVDASLRIGHAHLGVRRSGVRTPEQAETLARAVIERTGFRLVGCMFYDAQIAGLADTSPAVRLVKRASHHDLRERRSAVVSALRDLAPLQMVNAGGTGSVHSTGRDPTVTELTAGSGLFGPTLFDDYDDFTPRPAAAFALPVLRKPAADIATLYSGGYVASGPAGASRLPQPTAPGGLRLLSSEGAGEVQTPVKGSAARLLRPGDRVWLRHAKAGEMCERFDRLHLVEEETARAVPTYRGEGQNFG